MFRTPQYLLICMICFVNLRLSLAFKDQEHKKRKLLRRDLFSQYLNVFQNQIMHHVAELFTKNPTLNGPLRRLIKLVTCSLEYIFSWLVRNRVTGWLLRSCLLITLITYLKGHNYLLFSQVAE